MSAALRRTVERAQDDDFEPYGDPGKFEGEPRIVLRLYEMSHMGGEGELGEVDCFGYFSLLLDVKTADGTRHYIVSESSQGFFGIASEHTTRKEAEASWADLEKEYEESGCAEEGDS